MAATSGRTSSSRPDSVQQLEALARAAFGQNPDQFVADSLRRNRATISHAALGLPPSSPASIVNPNRAANRMARSIRRWSSSKRTQRVADGADDAVRAGPRRPRRSRSPSLGSAPQRSSGSSIRALMVKSRRRTSWRGSVSKATCSGRRPSRSRVRCGTWPPPRHPPARRRSARPPVCAPGNSSITSPACASVEMS